MYAQLGSIQFTPIKGFSSFSATRETNIVEHTLIEMKPKLQRVGTNLTAIELVMLLDAGFCDPQTEINALNDSRELGEILPLVMGDGLVVGNFVIRSVAENQLNHTKEGTLTQAEVTVSLIEYAGIPSDESSSAIAAAFANVNNEPPTYVPVAVPVTEEMQATQSVVNASAGINTTVNTISELTQPANTWRPKVEAVINSMVTVGNELNKILQRVNADPASEMYERTRDLVLVIEDTVLLTDDVISEGNAVLVDIDNGNVAGAASKVAELINKGKELSTKSGQISSKSASLISLTTVQ